MSHSDNSFMQSHFFTFSPSFTSWRMASERRPTGLTILLTDKRKPAPLEDGALAGVTIRGPVQARRAATSVLDWRRIHEGPCRLPSRPRVPGPAIAQQRLRCRR